MPAEYRCSGDFEWAVVSFACSSADVRGTVAPRLFEPELLLWNSRRATALSPLLPARKLLTARYALDYTQDGTIFVSAGPPPHCARRSTAKRGHPGSKANQVIITEPCFGFFRVQHFTHTA